jgi:hypothetical protein
MFWPFPGFLVPTMTSTSKNQYRQPRSRVHLSQLDAVYIWSKVLFSDKRQFVPPGSSWKQHNKTDRFACEFLDTRVLERIPSCTSAIGATSITRTTCTTSAISTIGIASITSVATPHPSHLLVSCGDSIYCGACGHWGRIMFIGLLHECPEASQTKFYETCLERLSKRLDPIPTMNNLLTYVLEVGPK